MNLCMSLDLGFSSAGKVYKNLGPDESVKLAVKRKEGILSENGALVIYTGKYTGRSPRDKFIVKSNKTKDVDWGDVNQPCSKKLFDELYEKVVNYLSERDLFVYDAMVGAEYSMGIRLINDTAARNLFFQYLMLRKKPKKIDFTILAAPKLKVNMNVNGKKHEALVVINFDKNIALIAGTEYCGEIKKAVFTVMNYYLPKKGVLPMHCSANIGKDTAIFFGLSGTGKTTLSADPDRKLIGDDEHGWFDGGVFNFEGGLYAKCIRLDKEDEPEIYNAIRKNSLVENVVLKNGIFDFDSDKIAENTRAAFPVDFMPSVVKSGKGGVPKTIIFLTADAFGVSKLSVEGAMYHFLSGYTSKLAGTERGIIKPKPFFSACFGAPFMPLKPIVYAKLLGKFIRKYKPQVFLINTGWIHGPYGKGDRISIKHTRSIVSEALDGDFDNVNCYHDKIFNLDVPQRCVHHICGVLNPEMMWEDKKAYRKAAKKLAKKFVKNFKKFDGVPSSVVKAGPLV